MIIKDTIDIIISDTHPRILINENDFKNLKSNINSDVLLKKWYNMIKNKIDKTLNNISKFYTKKDIHRLDLSSIPEIIELSFIYNITNDKKYADKAWERIETVLNYKDWNPNHFLDTCMISYSISIGYDWLFNYLSSTQKQLIEKNLIDKSLKIGLNHYKNNSHFFVNDKYNWNIVCNTGLILSSISILGNNNICVDVIKEGLKSINNGIYEYNNDGDSIEGISYWDYGTKYLAYFLSTITSSTNLISKYINNKGLYETSKFPAHMVGKPSSYNYSDSDLINPVGSMNLWFAKMYNDPNLTWYHKYYLSNHKSISIYDIIWYDSKLYSKGKDPELDKVYNRQSIITMRTDWYNINTSFVGCKGGLNGASHGDLDVGSFIFDKYSERWFIDLGKENYNVKGYWDKSINGERWKYYRKKSEGHNTLYVNNKEQNVGVHCPVLSHNINNNNPSCTLDLTNAYLDSIKVHRSFNFINRDSLLIEDDYEFKYSSEIIWQAHTQAKINKINNSKLELSLNNKKIYIEILDNINSLKFDIVKAEPYIPVTFKQSDNNKINKIIIKCKDIKGNIKVLIY